MQNWNKQQLIQWVQGLANINGASKLKIVGAINEHGLTGSDFHNDIGDADDIREICGIQAIYANRLLDHIEARKNAAFGNAFSGHSNSGGTTNNDEIFDLNMQGVKGAPCCITGVRASYTLAWLKTEYQKRYGTEHDHSKFKALNLICHGKPLKGDDKTLRYHGITSSRTLVSVVFRVDGGMFSFYIPYFGSKSAPDTTEGMDVDPEETPEPVKYRFMGQWTTEELCQWINHCDFLDDLQKSDAIFKVHKSELSGKDMFRFLENKGDLVLYFFKPDLCEVLFSQIERQMKLDRYHSLIHKPMNKWRPKDVQFWIGSLPQPLPIYASEYKKVTGKELPDINHHVRIQNKTNRESFQQCLHYMVQFQTNNAKCKNGKNNHKNGEKKAKKIVKKKTFNTTTMEQWTCSMVENWIKSLPGDTFNKYVNKFAKVNGSQLKEMDIDDVSNVISSKIVRNIFFKNLKVAIEKYGDKDNNGEDSNKRVNGVVGLNNLGNTCYLNTSIQLLSQTPLAIYLAKRAKIIGIKKNGGSWSGNGKASMLNAWMALCDVIYNQYSRGYPTYRPSKIVSALRDIDPEFGSGRQDDSTRSLRFMLQALDEEIEKEVMKTKKMKKALRYQEQVDIEHGQKLEEKEEKMVIDTLLRKHNPNDTIVRKLFDGVMRVINTCIDCGFIHQQYVIYRELDLPVGTDYVTFNNINVIFMTESVGQSTIHMEKVSNCRVLDYCSVDVLKYEISKKLKESVAGCQTTVLNGDVDNIDIVRITNNRIESIQSLQECSGPLFAFCRPKAKREASNVYEFVINWEKNKQQLESACCISLNKSEMDKTIQQRITDVTSCQENNVSVFYNGQYKNTSELAKYNFAKSDGGCNLLVFLVSKKTNDDNAVNWENVDVSEMVEAISRYPNKSPINALEQRSEDLQKMETSNSICRFFTFGYVTAEVVKGIPAQLGSITDSIHELQKIKKMQTEIGNAFLDYAASCNRATRLNDLEQCFGYFEQSKIFDESRFKHNCKKCERTAKLVMQQKRIVHAPAILVLHLDRYGKNSKSAVKQCRSDSYNRTSTMKFKINQEISALDSYDNRWKTVTVLKVQSYRIYIHWNGYQDQCDEWIKQENYSKMLRTSSGSSNSNSNSYSYYSNSSNKFDHAVAYEYNGSFANNKYNLFGVSNHSGSTTKGGHYTANVQSLTNKQWYSISDSYVQSSDKHSALGNQRDATILMYSRQ